ncbi:glycosyltransferase family 2 protein [Priestia megaterium]|uniref:glycosyltransferase family 2 protein n=1 Tax=Priestia megaterium TaxID=1404 RepID=UPI000BECB399|nr:glycosyltransferase [Priestia megaterium]PED65890.1 glycosyl transferase family 2 [Priestia megaterium]
MSTISVLIPTYNAENYIKLLLEKLYLQKIGEADQLEIIIVDSNSTDNTEGIVREYFPGVMFHTISNKEFDHGGTRNYMASLSSGEFLLFMTQDAIPVDAFLIRNLLTDLKADSNTMIAYARQIPKKDANELEKFARKFNYPPNNILKNKLSIQSMGIKTFFNSNVCSMYKLECFEQFGGFPEQIILNEDMILASKVILKNHQVAYSANSIVYHSHNYSLKQQFKRYFDIGMAFNDTKFLLKHASNEKEGFKMIKEQIKHLILIRKPHIIPKAIIENIIKFIGYNVGKRNKYIPYKVKRNLSAYMK